MDEDRDADRWMIFFAAALAAVLLWHVFLDPFNRKEHFTMKPQSAIVACVIVGSIGTAILGQVPRAGEKYIYSVLPDSKVGAFLVRVEVSTGDVECRMPNREASNLLREFAEGLKKETDDGKRHETETAIARLTQQLKREWVSFREFSEEVGTDPAFQQMRLESGLSDVRRAVERLQK